MYCRMAEFVVVHLAKFTSLAISMLRAPFTSMNGNCMALAAKASTIRHALHLGASSSVHRLYPKVCAVPGVIQFMLLLRTAF